MFKKISLVLVAAAMAFALVSCAAPAKYADVKEVMVSLTTAIEKANADLTAATDGAGVAAAIDGFSKAMTDLGPKMKELQAKYPEMQGAEPPAELKESVDKFTTAMTGFLGASMEKMTTFADDEAVKTALENMQSSMSALQ